MYINLTATENSDLQNCSFSGIDEFPSYFTASPPVYTYAVICALLTLYLFVGLAIICDEYCVPAVEKLCYDHDISYAVAGATFLAFATSAPEFFVNMFATFLTKSDMGIGTIVGSGVFNALFITGLCGIISRKNFYLDWWPLTRDSLLYAISIGILAMAMQDGRIYWHEAIVLLIFLLINLAVLIFDKTLQLALRDPETPCRWKCFQPAGEVSDFQDAQNPADLEDDRQSFYFILGPAEPGLRSWLYWCLTYPWRFVFYLTTPNPTRTYYVLSFIISTIWISVITYLTSWFLTVIGYHFFIPDSVMGISILAIGTSIPEAISCVIVSRKGLGSMAVCNAVSSNNFDILLCLGLPWFVKAYYFPTTPTIHAVGINSAGLFYAVVLLYGSVIILYVALMIERFELNVIVGVICIISYVIYLIFTVTVEMYLFWDVKNLPHCNSI